VADLGDPTSYLELPRGVPVLTAGGEQIGQVDHVLADADADIFDGLIVDTRSGPGGHRFADAEQVERLFTGGVVLTVGSVDELPAPSENPAVLETDADDTAPDHLGDKLRRAWHWISGNY
jgi:hypothetical protein